MAPLFSKDGLNKFWHDVQNEVTLIYAKFGKDLFSISVVIGRKTKWPRFFDLFTYKFISVYVNLHQAIWSISDRQ